ncbi:MAG: UDP-N-acetylglucosamine 2-epimerase (non-hydrolyzing) [Planctomycetota bacterium]
MSVKVLSVFGTRPEAIKMAPVVRQLATDDRFLSRVAVTGQHREMLDQVLDVFGIVPDHDLAVMRPGQDLFDVTSAVLLGLREVLRAERPDIVLVHGDTTTCFAASLAAFYEGVPVGHVEAGLRTGDLSRPFPEELNRVLTGRIARVHFSPTQGAAQNLLDEGVPAEHVIVTGNTVIDALLDVRDGVKALGAATFAAELGSELAARIDQRSGPLVLVTGHRRESFGEGFANMCQALRSLALRHTDWAIVFPVHLNPRIRGPVHELIGDVENIHLIEPLEYRPFVWLMDRADAILTDSGGIQEEGPSLQVPVLVTRDVTERPEAVAAGTVALVGTDTERIIAGLEGAVLDEAVRARMCSGTNPYGDGLAARRIADHLAQTELWQAAAKAAPAPAASVAR